MIDTVKFGKLYYLYSGKPGTNWAVVKPIRLEKDDGKIALYYELVSGETIFATSHLFSEEDINLYLRKHKSHYAIDKLTHEIKHDFGVKSGVHFFSTYIKNLINSNTKLNIFIGNEGWLSEMDSNLFVEIKNRNITAFAPFSLMSNFSFENAKGSYYEHHYEIMQFLLNVDFRAAKDGGDIVE